MKAVIVYDTMYGNTEKIAQAIGGALTPSITVKLIRVGEANLLDLESIDLLIVGSPTQGGRPTKTIQEFLGRIPVNALNNVGVTSFDTRISGKERGFGVRFITGIFGFAAGRIVDSLKANGGYLAAPPEGFIVLDNEGPLKEGELERAAAWAKGITLHKGQ